MKEQITNTVEFEYSSKKFAQLTQIEEQLQKKLDGYNCKSNFFKILLALLCLAGLLSIIKFSLIQMPESPITQQQDNVIEAETNIFKYQKQMVLGAKDKITDHQK